MVKASTDLFFSSNSKCWFEIGKHKPIRHQLRRHIPHHRRELPVPEAKLTLTLSVDLFYNNSSVANVFRLLCVTSALLSLLVFERSWPHNSYAQQCT
jgi:hypothetical protein